MKVTLEGQKRGGPGSGQAAHQSSAQKQERQRLKREIKKRYEDSRDTFMADRSCPPALILITCVCLIR